ncbi:hypothetical protein Q8F55_006089 [Vanrija albida]|uniref:Purine nucleoside permease n=1 Tax=Vanrija albida TaxID=181172 RepID=A0ABR3Q3F3_9TREE
MRLLALASAAVTAACVAALDPRGAQGPLSPSAAIAPKVLIVSMFAPEDVWTERLHLTHNYTLPLLHPHFPSVHCDAAGAVCQVTTAMGEINAAVTVTALLLSPLFDLSRSYFLFAGIAGVDPHFGTTGSAALAHFAVQVALAYEIDPREAPEHWETGYFLQGTSEPNTIDGVLAYGTEVYELNTNLRDRVHAFAANVSLVDSEAAADYRAKFDYAPANEPPALFYGDVATTDVFFSGHRLGAAFANITALWTKGEGTYTMSAQEDNASFEALLRAHKIGLVDFTRAILLRTASNFDRPPPGLDALTAMRLIDSGGFAPSVDNLWVVGAPIVQGILDNWAEFEAGVPVQDGWLHADDGVGATSWGEYADSHVA